ncbi:MAG: LysM peptidoglycan-binding domain-containing protein [Desulfobacteraceae bacterium]|nr:LysM peptidoglycan-binding domain-containing protein [Desulfobacteraceae bacterium]
MKWKNTQKNREIDEKPDDSYFDEEQYSALSAENSGNISAGPDGHKRTDGSLKIIVVGFIIVIILVVLFTPGLFSRTGTGKTVELENRIAALEQKLQEFEGVDTKVTQIWGQAKTFEKFKDRFDRSEASMSLRMDHIAMSLDTIQKKLAETQTAMKPPVVTDKTPAAKPVAMEMEKAGAKYHIVKKGETLYRISVLYKVKVEALIRMNGLASNPVIQPGQKLVIAR